MTISSEALAWMMQKDQPEPGIWLVTVNGLLRFAIDKKPVTSRGEIFKEGYIIFEEPGDSEDIPVCKVTVPNVDREIGLFLEDATSGLTLLFELVRDGSPDQVVWAWRNMRLKNANIDPLMITGELSAASFEDEPYAPLRITPSAFPGLYR
jgi:hypothetical protein